MATVTLPNDLTNGAQADADQVMDNFAALLAAINGGLDVSNLAASLSQMLPRTGDARASFVGDEPAGWLICDGRGVSRATYAALFAKLGSTYGPGDGATTFNLPDLRGRVLVGKGTGVGGGATDADGGSPPAGGAALGAKVLGQWGGEDTHTLLAAESGVNGSGVTGAFNPVGQSKTIGEGGTASTYWTGNNTIAGAQQMGIGLVNATSGLGLVARNADAAHNNLQPFVVVNVLVKT